ncbi:FTR1 family protein [Gottfriedia acidiceleris]|uniref:FTR1 family protein n=1 Tax=Gottfriedia acidiceleris TaxID=371036 RepID=UPI0014306757|nr:FTR1 family protein [Gottfriedia acidiceleris]
MNANFLIALREGLEVSLVIGFLLITLIQSKKEHLIKSVIYGTILGVLVSIFAGFFLFTTFGELDGNVEHTIEGVIQLIAALLIFYFIYWLSGQSSINISDKLKSEVKIKDNNFSLFLMASVFVIREGLELVLFVLSNAQSIAFVGMISILLGLIAAVLIAYLFIKTTINLNIKVIFTLLGILLIFFGGKVFTEGIFSFVDATPLLEKIVYYGFVVISLFILFKNNILSFFKK